MLNKAIKDTKLIEKRDYLWLHFIIIFKLPLWSLWLTSTMYNSRDRDEAVSRRPLGAQTAEARHPGTVWCLHSVLGGGSLPHRVVALIQTYNSHVKSKGKFSYSAVSHPQDCSKRFYTLLPWQTCSIKHCLNFTGKHPAKLQLMHEGCSYNITSQCTPKYTMKWDMIGYAIYTSFWSSGAHLLFMQMYNNI